MNGNQHQQNQCGSLNHTDFAETALPVSGRRA